MSTTVTLKATKSAGIDYTNRSQHVTPAAYFNSGSTASIDVLFAFQQLSSTYQYRDIESLRFYLYIKNVSNQQGFFKAIIARSILESFNIDTVTYDTRPDTASDSTYNNIYLAWDDTTYRWEFVYPSGHEMDAITNGVYVYVNAINIAFATSTAESAYRPYLSVTLSDTNRSITPTGYPRSGYKNPHNDIELSWSNSITSGKSVLTPTQTSAVVTWKETGGAENTISVTTAQSVTIPADTWSTGTSYQWKVAVTDSGGTTTTTDWYTISTTAAAADPPRPIEPDGAIYSSDDAIEFHWVIERSAYTGTDLAFSHDGSSWGDPVYIAGNTNRYTQQASTFPSGTNFWRARSYNEDASPGDWSDSKQFIVVAAPEAPYYEVTNTPRPTISWVSDEQQAFQVQMGDYDSGLVFGTAQSFKCPVYLPNGSTTVRVRVMNQYNLWSDWSGTQITIANTPGTAPVLTVTAGADAQLTWTDVGASRYLIYRDGALIGETDGLSFTDRYANGQASYFVRAAEALTTQTIALTDDYYINTNNPSGYVKIDSPTAAADTWSYAQVACVEGDRFIVTATGSNSYHLAYTFAQADKSKVAPTASANTSYTNEALTAPADAAWLVVNANMSNERSLKKIVHQAPDYYTDSNTVSVTIAVPCPMITAIDGNWIELQYSTEPIYTAQNTHTQQVSMMVYSGSVYPVPEIAPHRQRSYQIAVAFRRGESGPFEQLLGRECFLKDQYGAAIHGVISAIATAHNRWYTVCSATLEEMEGSL